MVLEIWGREVNVVEVGFEVGRDLFEMLGGWGLDLNVRVRVVGVEVMEYVLGGVRCMVLELSVEILIDM